MEKERLDIIEEKIDILSNDIQELKTLIKKLTETTGRMDNHISFVEETYSTLSYPLNVLKSSVEKIFPAIDK